MGLSRRCFLYRSCQTNDVKGMGRSDVTESRRPAMMTSHRTQRRADDVTIRQHSSRNPNSPFHGAMDHSTNRFELQHPSATTHCVGQAVQHYVLHHCISWSLFFVQSVVSVIIRAVFCQRGVLSTD